MATCKLGCGRTVAPGTTPSGHPFTSCCRGCGRCRGKPPITHDAVCEARFAGSASPGGGGATPGGGRSSSPPPGGRGHGGRGAAIPKMVLPPSPDQIYVLFDQIAGTTSGMASTATDGLKLKNASGDVDPKQLEGKVIAFYFSAGWCAPCKAFTPKLKDFYSALRGADEPIEIVFLSFDKSESDMMDYYNSHHGDWPYLDFSQSTARDRIQSKFKATRFPMLVVVTAKGEIADVGDARSDVEMGCASYKDAKPLFLKWQKAAMGEGDGKGISIPDILRQIKFVKDKFPSLLKDFSKIDKSQNGVLTKEEVLYFYHPQPEVEQKKTMEELLDIWGKLDKTTTSDGKEQITLENVAVSQDEIMAEVPDLINKFPEVDLDKDCCVDFKEFCCAFGNVTEWLNAQLALIVGLEGLKKQLRRFARGVQLNQKRRSEGKPIQSSGAYVFIYRGNPGTGKTKLARLTSTFLMKIGITKESKLVEVQRDDLCGRNPGESTNEAIEKAKGGVLFVDEAYRLSEGGPRDSAGKEAVETLMRAMTDDGNVFILAGYRTEMNDFLKVNAGLGRRVTHTFDFDDYNCSELAQILTFHVTAQNFTIDPALTDDSCKKLGSIIASGTMDSDRAKMNGGICEHICRFALDSLNDRCLDDAADTLTELNETDIEFGCKKASNNDYEGAHAESVVDWLKEQLNMTVGMENLKKQLWAFQKEVELNQARRARGLFVDSTKNLVMLFKGNPGCGKTRMARLMASLLERLGMTSSKKLVEVQREDLCGQHIGETAIQTKQQIENARGGVLFIDEAYRLAGEGKDYGKEAIETLMHAMTEPGNTIVVAGYPRDMDRFLQMNSGLARRITHTFEFDDFTVQDLAQIFEFTAKGRGFDIETGTDIVKIFEELTSAADRKEQNGGLCEHISRYAIQHLNQRVDPSSAGTTLSKDDIVFGCKSIGAAGSSFDGAAKPTDVVAWLDAELKKIIGLQDFKKQLWRFQKQVAMDQARRKAGHKVEGNNSTVMVFQGNPGTGKTTVGRLMAKLLEQLGICRNHKLIETQRDDLVAQYIGHTAVKTREVINLAKGGVLFVDEAYRLSEGSGGGESGIKDFGKEAIETLMQAMTEEGMVMILAGYPAEMKNFINMNAGIQRRITFSFDFDDYTVQDLAQILELHIGGRGYSLRSDVAGDALADVLAAQTGETERAAMNGGICEHIARHAIYNLNDRLSSGGSIPAVPTVELEREDLEYGCQKVPPAPPPAAAGKGRRKGEGRGARGDVEAARQLDALRAQIRALGADPDA